MHKKKKRQKLNKRKKEAIIFYPFLSQRLPQNIFSDLNVDVFRHISNINIDNIV